MKKQFILLALAILIFSCKNVEENPEPSNETKELSIQNAQIANGKALFSYHCRMCHDVNLRKVSTASALGNITKCRTEEYLLQATRDFIKVALTGNDTAKCTYDGFNRNTMLTYEHFSDEQIKNIYRFIEDESKRQNIKDDEVQHITSCYTDKNGSAVFLDQNGNQIIYKQSEQDAIKEVKIETDITDFQNEFNAYLFKTYIARNSSDNLKDKQIDIGKFRLKVKEAEHTFVRVIPIDKVNKKSIYPVYSPTLYYNDKGFQFNSYYVEDIKDSKITIYDDVKELTFLVIEESVADELLFGEITIPIKDINQTHQLNLEKLTKSQIQERINQ